MSLNNRTGFDGLVLSSVLACLLPGAAALAGTTIDRHVAADPTGTVEINNREGSVRCIGWDKPDVQISGELSSAAERLDVQNEGKSVNIRVVMRNGGFHLSGATDLTVKVPAASTVRIAGVSADIDVRGVTGEQKLQTVSGDVRTEAAGADLQLKTISGNIKARGKNGIARTKISTVSGNAEAIDIAGELELDTVSGDVELVMGPLSRARVQAISGDVTMTAHLNKDARIDASSVSGDMRMRWLGAESSMIDVETFSGDIDSCFGHTEVTHPKFGPGASWRYSAAGSAADIHVKTLSGDVSLCNR
jgi:DUF4097 and DUF4098 domain-containing protein YvlB